jgi:hypothetical protein
MTTAWQVASPLWTMSEVASDCLCSWTWGNISLGCLVHTDHPGAFFSEQVKTFIPLILGWVGSDQLLRWHQGIFPFVLVQSTWLLFFPYFPSLVLNSM